VSSSAAVCLLAAVALSCAASREPNPGSHEDSPRKVVILMYGFFNSESRERFAPEPITYAFLSLREAHDSIAADAKMLAWSGSVHVLSWAESGAMMDAYAAADREVVRSRLLEALVALDEAVQLREVPVKKAVNLKAPFIAPLGWGADDRVLVVVGLETVRRPNPRGITSVLGCFWFSGEGSYLGVLVPAYDFTALRTSDLAATVTGKCFQVSPGP
jgi:hypothetical protein